MRYGSWLKEAGRTHLWWEFLQELLELCRALPAGVQAREEVEVVVKGIPLVFRRFLPRTGKRTLERLAQRTW